MHDERRRRKNEGVRRYRDANPGRYLWSVAKARAKARGIPFSIEPEDVVVPLYCPVLGVEMVRGGYDGKESPSIDRIVNELGYVPGNIVVVSERVNAIKRGATPEELRKIAEFYSRLERSRKNSPT